MRTVPCGAVAFALTLLCASSVAGEGAQQPTAPANPYAEFVKLDYAARRQRLVDADAATRASIMRSHISNWLAENRGRLSARQVAAVADAIAFITPALYESPVRQDVEARSQELKARLVCRLRQSDIMTAFRPADPPMTATWLEDTSAWFTACLLGW